MKDSPSHRYIFLAIAFGTAIRDVLRTDLIKTLLTEDSRIKIVIFTPENYDAINSEFQNDRLIIKRLDTQKISYFERFLLVFQRSLLRDFSTTINLGNTAGKTISIDLIYPITRLLRLIFGLNRINKTIDVIFKKTAKPSVHLSDFHKYNPEILITTRLMNYSADYGIFKTATSLGVKTVALASSWDNFTSKGFFPFGLEKLIVWNSIMKEEAETLFSLPSSKISVCGPPRFDRYFVETILDNKTSFMSKFDNKPRQYLITYCTGSKDTGRTKYDEVSQEPEICYFIAQSLKKLKINAMLLVRLHPKALIKEYEILKDLDNVFIELPGEKKSFQDRVFSSDDELHYMKTLYFSDLLINMGSTASIDAAIFDIPIICIGFDIRGYRPLKHSMRKLYLFDHYAKLLSCGGIFLSNSKKELIDHIQLSLNKPSLLQKERYKMVMQQCEFNDGNSGKRAGLEINKLLKMVE